MLPLRLRDISQLDFNATGHPQPEAPTLANPHVCPHCKDILIDRSPDNKTFPIDTSEIRKYGYFPIELTYGLEQAVNASREGCRLYAWLLNDLRSISLYRLDAQDATHGLIVHLKFYMSFDSDLMYCDPLVEATFDDGNVIHLRHLEQSTLMVYSRGDDLAAKSVIARPPETDRFSAKSLQFAKACLATCLNHHEQCRTKWLRDGDTSLTKWLRHESDMVLAPEVIAAADLPTRLLELDSSDPPLFRLFEVQASSTIEKDYIANAGFAALSYCWGPAGNPMQLTAATYDMLRNGMSASSLPATIRDSMTFTARMGIKYLWVDALCIMQDSHKDRQLEIARMGSYYNANTLTICAASAPSCTHGLGSGTHDASSPIASFQLQYSFNGDRGTVLLYPKEKEYKLPTTERGWTLQESLLSRRLLIFSYQLFWCCVTSNVECEGYSSELSERPNRVFGGPESLVPGIYPVQALWDYPPNVQWHRGLDEFISRKLGVEGDKLLAISAFASFIHEMFRARGVADFPGSSSIIYLAGIFLLPATMPFNASQLYWGAVHSQDCRRTSVYRAPSWSWASVEGLVRIFDGVSMVESGNSCDFSLEGYEVQLVDPGAPYGAVESAVLRLTGILQPLSSSHHEVDYNFCKSATSKDTYAGGIYMFLLQGHRTSQHTISHGARGIVIQRTSNDAAHTFKRLGIFALRLHASNEKVKSETIDALGQVDNSHSTILLV